MRGRVIAPRMERVAAQDAPHGEPGTAPRPVRREASDRVPGAGGLEATTGPEQRGDHPLVDAYESDQGLGQHERTGEGRSTARRPSSWERATKQVTSLEPEAPGAGSRARLRRWACGMGFAERTGSPDGFAGAGSSGGTAATRKLGGRSCGSSGCASSASSPWARSGARRPLLGGFCRRGSEGTGARGRGACLGGPFGSARCGLPGGALRPVGQSLSRGLLQARSRALPLLGHLAGAQAGGARAGDHDDVEARGEEIGRRSEGSSHDALHAVADDGVAHAPGGGDAQARWFVSELGLTRSHQQNEGRRIDTTSFRLNDLKVGPRAYATLPTERARHGQRAYFS